MDIQHTLDTSAIKSASIERAVWYVSAGRFQNTANALALADKLKALGFVVVIKANEADTSVLLGPYDYPARAIKSEQRLKEIAHIQGSLISPKY